MSDMILIAEMELLLQFEKTPSKVKKLGKRVGKPLFQYNGC
jgi:hypothetical protein